MQNRFCFSAFLSLGLLILAAGAPQAVTAEPEKPADLAVLTTETQRLDTLFVRLKKTGDEDEARSISDDIRREWTDSGSASVNLLMQWAEKAVTDSKQAVALDIFDQVIALDPTYVEGWNRRATLHYQMGNYRKSMSDINQVLTLEPRHFGALAGMAAILSASGKDELALKAWERFLDVYPADRKAQEQVGELEEKLAGNRI